MWSRSVVVNQIVRDEDDGILGLKGRVLNVSLIDKRGEYESASTTFVAPFLTLSMSVDNTVGDLKTELEKHDASTYRDATRMGRTTRTSLCRFGVPHTTQREGTYYLLDEGLPIVQLPDRQLSTGFFPVFVLNNDCDGILGSIGPLVRGEMLCRAHRSPPARSQPADILYC